MGGQVEDGKGWGGETEGGLREGWQNSNNTSRVLTNFRRSI